MQYVEGLNLSQLVKRCGPLGIADACELVRQAALGLQCAHEHGLVHRDIKPSNLIVTAQGDVKVLDLGLALLREELTPLGDVMTEEAEVTRRDGDVMGLPSSASAAADDLTGVQVMGTCDYMAPEQTRNAHAVDIRADIYSLGCTLYKLLAGHAPFGGPEFDTPARKLAAHAQAPVPPIRQHRPEVPEQLAATLDRMLAKDPADRFATPAEVAEALQPWAAGSNLAGLLGAPAKIPPLPLAMNPPLPLGEGWGEGAPGISPPRRRRWLALAAGGSAAMLLLGIFLTVSTGKGTVQLEFADAEAARQCAISIDGDEIRLENLGDPIKLRPGKHQLRVTHGDLEIETREFSVLRRGAQVLRISIPVVSETPQSAQVYADRGREYGLNCQWKEAVAAYSEAIRLAPSVAQYRIARGELYWGRGGNTDPPLADFSEAIRLDPNSADARVSRGAIYCHARQIEKAVPDFKAALRISPDCVERHFRRAEAYGEEYGRWRAYYGEYFKAVAIRWSLVQSDKRELDAALVDFRKLLPLRDDIVPASLHWTSWWLPTVLRGRDKLAGIVFVSDMPWVRSTCGWGPTTAQRNTVYGRLFLFGPLPYSNGIGTHAFGDPRPADVVVDVSGHNFVAFKAHVGGTDLGGSVEYQVLADGKVIHQTPVFHFGKLQSISVDLAGAKEITLRVLNGGDGGISDGARWAFARFVEAGADDPLEVPPAELESATDANAAFFLAKVHWRLDQKDLARRWFDKAAAWMDKNRPDDENLRRYRAEAAEMLGIPEEASTGKEQPG